MATQEEAVQAIADIETALATLREFVEGSEGAGAPAEAVTVPSPDDLAAMDKSEYAGVAEKLGMNVEGQKPTAIKLMLTTLHAITQDEEVDPEAVSDLAETLGLTPAKKVEKTIEAIKEWVAALGTEGEASTEESDSETPAAEDDSESETPAAEEDAETPAAEEDEPESSGEDDGVDREAVAAKVKKFPDTKTMIKHLKAYNAKADDEIEFNEKKEQSIKDGYRKLLAEMVDSSGAVAAWGVAYFRDGGAWCCGRSLEDNPAVTKKSKKQAGTCTITGKVFVLDESGEDPEMVEYKK